MEKRTKDYLTPQREPAANRRSRKPQTVRFLSFIVLVTLILQFDFLVRSASIKIAKSLAATFSSLSDDIIQPISKEPDFSPISTLSNIHQIPDIDSSFLQGVDPALSTSSESLLSTDLSTPPIVTFDNKQLDKVPVDFSGSNDSEEASAGSIEAEIAANFLRRALTRVLQSTDIDHQSKKLIDASIRIIVDDSLAISQECDHLVELISAKNHVLSLGLFMWFIILALAFFYCSGVENSFVGPLPT